MTNRTEHTMQKGSVLGDVCSSLFGVVFLAIGLINMFWANEPRFRFFIIPSLFVYLLPMNSLVKKHTGFSLLLIAKSILGIFILWAAIGIPKLFNKIERTRKNQ